MAVLPQEIVIHQNWGRQSGQMFLTLAFHRLVMLFDRLLREVL